MAHVNFLVISQQNFPDAFGPGYQMVPPLVPGQKFKTSITFATGVRFRPTNYQNEAIVDEYFGFCTQQYETLSGHNPVNCSTRARLNTWMQSFRAWQGLFQFNSGANLLINIIEGPRKLSVDFATEYSGCFRTWLPKGTPFGAWAKIKTSITFATGIHFRPTNYQNEAIDDEYISSISDFAPNNMKHYSATSRYIARRARVSIDGWSRLEHDRVFFSV